MESASYLLPLPRSNLFNMSSAALSLLSIDHITVRYLNKTLFESLSLHIRKGEQWAVLGGSGSGKSALLQTILGRFNIINGKISYAFVAEYKKINNIADPLFSHHQLMAFVGQQAQFKNKQNTRDFFYQQRFHSWFSGEAITVAEYLQAQQQKNEAGSMKIIRFSPEWIVRHLHLQPLLHKTLIQLSNGETRRLMIAHALLKQPLLLVMDNPYLGLDVDTRPVLDKLLKKVTEKGTHLLMATAPGEIPECITHILFLNNLKVAYAGNKEGFKIEQFAGNAMTLWQPDEKILAKIEAVQPRQNSDFQKVLSMENIQVKYGDNYILKGINWEVNRGEKWALTGANGAGKSTLLSLIYGDHPQAYANKIKLFDRKKGNGESIWEIKKRMGYVSPEMHQYFRGNNDGLTIILSGLEDTMGFLKKEVTESEKQLALYWLQLLELEQLKAVRFQDMAAGEQRLILLLRALIKNPPLLILDEPCQGLDQQQKKHFIRIIDQLWSSPYKTLLYVSHYKEDIPSCVDHVLRLEQGRSVGE